LKLAIPITVLAGILGWRVLIQGYDWPTMIQDLAAAGMGFGIGKLALHVRGR
jgi:hypothetical protein